MPVPWRRTHPGKAAAVTAALLAALAVLAAGCSPARPSAQASVQSCVQFGIAAIERHVTVTSLPPACRGLTRDQVNVAVGSALHAAAGGAGGKARERARIVRLSRFLQRLVTTVPLPRGQPPVAVAAPARPPGRSALGPVTAATWLVTASLGLWMRSRRAAGSRRPRGRAAGSRRPRGRAARFRRPPPLVLAHLALAVTGLLTWLAYLASGAAAVAWAACALLPPAAGLGMALVFAAPAAGVPAGEDPQRARRPPVLAIAAHIGFATATILLAFLTAIGAG